MENKIKVMGVYFIIVFITVSLGLTFFEYLNYKKISKIDYSYVWPPNFQYVFNPDTNIFNGISGTSHFTINSFGYRGDMIEDHEDEYRILILGGSTSECLYLDDKETWPYLLMGALGETVEGKKVITMNIGKSGHGLRNNLLALKYLPDYYEPDLIIILTGANDVLFRLSRKSAWQPFNESEFDRTESYTFSLTPEYSWKSTIVYNIYKSIEFKFKGVIPQDGIGKTLVENRLKRQTAENWVYEIPDLTFALEDYERILERVIVLSKEKNSSLMFLTQHYLYKENMTEEEDANLWMTYDFGDTYYSTEIMIYSLEEFNKKLLNVCEKNEEIFCIDLEAKVPKTSDYMYDDMHFNENGARFVAEEISSFMKENIPEFQLIFNYTR
ncbi:SGNH/GDSL hydrolase family protein [Patescibacteria group bacterium]|nr:SGNH/GDSL hydrolase family protein [Patescibacteria group bacterium]